MIKRKHEQRLNQIKSLIEENPLISATEISKRLRLSLSIVTADLKKAGIEREREAVTSAALYEANRRGRVKLTGELLYRMHITENKSQSEISRELGYSLMCISMHIKKFGVPTSRGRRPQALKTKDRE